MRFKERQVTGDAAGVFATLVGIIILVRIKDLAQVFVAHALNQEFAMKQSFKELAVLRTDGPESSELPPPTLDRPAYSVEQFIRWSWFTYDCQRLQIALIRGTRDFTRLGYRQCLFSRAAISLDLGRPPGGGRETASDY